MTERFCRMLEELTAEDLPVAGGKGANLGELVRSGLPVPAGFVVTTAAYTLAVEAVAGPGYDEVLDVELPAAVRDAIGQAYEAMGEGRVAVRSSATAEDLPGAAFAGQQDTFLGVEGLDAVLEAVRLCWASLWGERAVAYRARLGLDDAAVAIAVVVQRMVPSQAAGVLFTADPVTGARDRVVVDWSPGLGEAVVSGMVTPEHAVVGPDGAVLERRAGRAEVAIRQSAAGGTETVPLEAPVEVSEAQLGRLAALGRRIAGHFGRPQDVEWAIVDDAIWILQARPMTALPPAPRALTRRQRYTGPVILELLPRRPYPMEVSAWIVPAVGRHLERMLDEMAGVGLRLADAIPADDWVVREFVPPNPRPSRRTPARLARTVGRMRRDPRAWVSDPRLAQFRAAVDDLNGLELSAVGWSRLLALPDEVGVAGDLITALRVEYLPAAAGAMVRLRLLLRLLRLGRLFPSLLLDAATATQEANAEIAAMAAMILADPQLARRAHGLDGRELLELVGDEPAAAPVRAALEAFLRRCGHRETLSVLLPKEPTWGDAPETVMSLVAVLLDGEAGPRQPARAGDDALAVVQRHALVRAARGQRRVARLVRKASAAAAVREDTHFELTRVMPVVQRVVREIGARLAAAQAIADPDDVWYLTLDDLRLQTGPADPSGLLAATVARRRAAYEEVASSPLIAPSSLYPVGQGRPEGVLVSGVGGGGGKAEGLVRLIAGPGEFSQLRDGEVLVCAATNPSWTPLFARAAAVVVDHGGLASHAAIVAREYGIAAVMGTGDGTRVLVDGQRVVVDGERGFVTRA